jgi:hypothetical protein
MEAVHSAVQQRSSSTGAEHTGRVGEVFAVSDDEGIFSSIEQGFESQQDEVNQQCSLGHTVRSSRERFVQVVMAAAALLYEVSRLDETGHALRPVMALVPCALRGVLLDGLVRVQLRGACWR